MKIKKLFRKIKFMVGKKEEDHIRHFLANFGLNADHLISFSFNSDEMILCIEEAREAK